MCWCLESLGGVFHSHIEKIGAAAARATIIIGHAADTVPAAALWRGGARFHGHLLGSPAPAGRADSSVRRRRTDRRRPCGFGLGARCPADRLLAVRAQRRRPRGRLDAGARMVFRQRDLLRDSRLRAAWPADRDPRRPRPDFWRRQHPDPARHVPRRQEGVDVCRQPVGCAGRRRARRGCEPPGAAGYEYDVGNPQVGGNVRWGLTDNLTLNGTIKPDFSQVESDAGQLAFDPRQALFFPEKRPFFLEGSELFQVPQNLIYTRRIVQPVAAVKLTGTTFGTDIGLLSAVDQKFASVTGSDNPIFNILRAQRSLGRGSRVGLVYTDRIEGGDYNRVAEVDSRLVFKEIYGLNLQLAGSRTRTGGVTTTAPLWLTQFTIQHRIWGLRSVFAGISDQFRDASGFIGRAGIVHSYVDPSYTAYGGPGAWLQRFTGDILVDGIWQYQNFIHGRHLQDKKLHFNGNATLRGGWNVGAGYFVESFGYDSALYAAYRLGRDTAARFTGQPTITNGEYIVQIGTPQ